jgi:alkylated DNA repair dioxygenase AlkB
MTQAHLFKPQPETILDNETGRIVLVQQALSPESAGRVFDQLRHEVNWQQDQLRIAGRCIPIPRLQSWYGDAGALYGYSGLSLKSNGWTPTLLELRELVEHWSCVAFNSVLLNLYRDGQDSVGWHSDDEPELGRQPVIASLSLGASRYFSMRRKRSGEGRIKIQLDSGSLLVMSGALQHCWQHQVAKTSVDVGERINLTFRWVRPD